MAGTRMNGMVGLALATLAASFAGPSALAQGVVINEIMYHPASQNPAEEFIELTNTGTNTVNLTGWRISGGIEFDFPQVSIRPGGYVVVAADVHTFTNAHPNVTGYVGGWVGRLGRNGERLTLVNPLGDEEDSVGYADEGDWAARVRGPLDHGHYGWAWRAAHDGEGKSLELINASMSNNCGQNWAASINDGGTPGAQNSMARRNIAPLITRVSHSPPVPRSTNSVTVTARIRDEAPVGTSVRVFHRVDGTPEFTPEVMWDDGRHGDGAPADGVYGAVLAPQANNTVVEFYIEATDWEGLVRTWPAPVQPEGRQLANALYQVDDSIYTGPQPLHRITTTEAERAELEIIDALPWSLSSDAQMNATFISQEGGRTEVRYLVGFRLRGTTSRMAPTKSRRVNFRNDDEWRGLRAVYLNGNNPHSQVIGSVLCRLAGLPAACARPVQVRQNNRQLAGSIGPPFGSYAEVEVEDSAFLQRRFPDDPSGNLYHAYGDGRLDYLGEDPADYGPPAHYSKETNASLDDWSDLIELTRTLANAADATYATEVSGVANVDEWVRFFAVNTVLANAETSLASGAGGDYALYRGLHDKRFQLIVYDLDSVLGVAGSTNYSILRAIKNPAINRLLSWPDFAEKYYTELQRLMATTLAPQNANLVLDQFLGDWVPAPDLQAMKDFIVQRNAFIQARIPAKLAVRTDLPLSQGYYYTTNGLASFYGWAAPANTGQVLVNGQPASWNTLLTTWETPDISLLPGINRICFQALNGQGREIENVVYLVWFDTGATTGVTGTLAADSRWTPAQGPYLITSNLVVPPGITLTIEPGTTVFFETNASIQVAGRLLAEGAPDRHIRLTRPPQNKNSWQGIVFNDAKKENRLSHLDMIYAGAGALTLTNSTLLLDHVTWSGTTRNVITTQNSALRVQNCTFPSIYYDEHVRGTGMPADGYLVFENNVFGATTGYADIIDFTGGHFPGPVLQVLNNVFLGGGDDALDLDATDAYIDGNVFMHFHKNNSSTSESSAIATGTYKGEYSHLVVTRNVFFDNDYHMVLKERAVVEAQNNTFVKAVKGALCFLEPERPSEGPPRKVQLDGNIFWDQPVVMANLDYSLITNGTVELTVNRSILPESGPWAGVGNSQLDPRFVNPTNDFHLLPGSPATRTGPNGADMGAYVPAGASISGEPYPQTSSREATLVVGGPAIRHYRYCVNEGPYGLERPVSEPISLTGLTNGVYAVRVLGKDVVGRWQSESSPTVSREWMVHGAAWGVRINEILARNATSVPLHGGYPDLVELYNGSLATRDLSGLSLSDDPALPRKFMFPDGTALAAGAYLVLQADSRTNLPGFHLGFQLSGDGESLFLYSKVEDGGLLLESVSFGPQLQDLSIGRLANGQWTLTYPTLGGTNVPHPLGDPRMVTISEWLANTGPFDRDDFIELFNGDSLPVDLGGLGLSSEPVESPFQHVIAPLSFIPPRGYLAFVADGQADNGANHLSFNLPAEQGMVGLHASDGSVLDSVAYASQLPGTSQGREPGGFPRVTSFPIPTPGAVAADSDDPRFVVLNELLADNRSSRNAAGDTPDWVELHNRSDQAVDMTGARLTDTLQDTRRWVFGPGTVIPAKGFLVVYLDPGAAVSATNTNFGIDSGGDALYLLSAGPGDAVIDSIEFGPQAADCSIGRVPDGTGAWRLTQTTPGEGNLERPLGNIGMLKVNEWMALPSAGDDWFELYNPDLAPIELSGLLLTDFGDGAPPHVIPPLSFIGFGAAAYQLFWADGNADGRANHVDFRLSSEGDYLAILTGEGSLIDRVVFGTQERAVSQGRYPDGGSRIGSFPRTSSPGRANTYNTTPWLVDIADQTVELGSTLIVQLAAVDPDVPPQRLSYSFSSVPPEGATLDAASGALIYAPVAAASDSVIRMRVTATDNGTPNLSDSVSFNVTVVGYGELTLRVTLAANLLRLAWNAEPNRTYAIEWKKNLEDPSWTVLDRVTPSGRDASYSTTLEGGSHRFFRLSLEP